MEKVAEELTPGREGVNENILNKVKQLLIKFDKISLSWKVVSDLVVAIGRVGQASERFLVQIWNATHHMPEVWGGNRERQRNEKLSSGSRVKRMGMGWPCAKICDRHCQFIHQTIYFIHIYPSHGYTALVANEICKKYQAILACWSSLGTYRCM